MRSLETFLGGLGEISGLSTHSLILETVRFLEGDEGSSTTTIITLAWTKVSVPNHTSFSFLSIVK